MGLRGDGTSNVDAEFIPSKAGTGSNLDHRYHSNTYNPVGVSPYRNTFHGAGYSITSTVFQMDRDTGRMYVSGSLSYGMDSVYGGRDSNT